MDADDVSLLTLLEKQISFLGQHEDIAVCGRAIEEFDEKGTIKIRKNQYYTQNDCFILLKHRS